MVAVLVKLMVIARTHRRNNGNISFDTWQSGLGHACSGRRFVGLIHIVSPAFDP